MRAAVAVLLGLLLALSPARAEPPASSAPRAAPVYYVLDGRIGRVEADGTGARVLELTYGSARELAVAPVTGQLAFVDGDALVLATERAVLRRVALPKDAGRVHALRWSPKGEFLAVGADRGGMVGGDVLLLRPDASVLVPLPRTEGGDMDPTWSPDGRWLAVVHVTRTWTVKHAEDWSEEFWDGGIDAIDVTTLARQRRVAPAERLHSAAWSPDGRWVAYASITDVYVSPAGGRAGTSVLKGNVGEGPLWTPDGGRLVVTLPRPLDPKAGPDDMAVKFDLVSLNRDGGERRSFLAGDVQSLALSPDGRQIALLLAYERVVRATLEGQQQATLFTLPAGTTSEGLRHLLSEVSWAPRR